LLIDYLATTDATTNGSIIHHTELWCHNPDCDDISNRFFSVF